MSLRIAVTAKLIINESACTTGLLDWSKPIPLIWELPFAQWCDKIFHESEHPVSLILEAMSEQRIFSPQGGIWLGWYQKEGWHFISCHVVQVNIIPRIVFAVLLNLRQCYLVWEVSLVDKLQDVKPQVWLDQICSVSLQDIFSVRSSLCIP